jgi:NDP-sugar pyrophosphorylase family protein
MLAERQRLAGCLQEGYFVDIGTPDSLAAFERDIQKGVFVYGS